MGLFLLKAKLAVASRLRCKVLNHRLGLKSQLTSYIFYQMKNLKNVMLRIFQTGIIPRAFSLIFESLVVIDDTKFLVRASYLEIYNEEVRDLLGKDLKSKVKITDFIQSSHAYAQTRQARIRLSYSSHVHNQLNINFKPHIWLLSLTKAHITICQILNFILTFKKAKLEVKESPDRGVFVRGISNHQVGSVSDCEVLMARGWKNRSTGETLMNKEMIKL